MADFASKWTDAELRKLERRMAKEYSEAAAGMREKQRKWLKNYAAEREAREKALDGTKEAMEAHRQWLRSQANRREWLDSMASQLADSATKANQKAVAALNDHLPAIYSENASMAAFSVDKAVKADTGFTLVNEDAVRYLMQQDGSRPLIHEVIDIGPAQYEMRGAEAVRLQSMRKDIDVPRDIRWNRQKFDSAITQGILRGESVPDIVKRVESIYGSNKAAAMRAVRTAVTSAENAGRKMAYERAARLGIDMEITWMAVHDERTRTSHREMDGEKIRTGEVFSNGLEYPGDPAGEPAETYNCRCRYAGKVVGFDGERGEWADSERETWTRLPEGMTYKEWKAARPKSRAESYKNESAVVSGAWMANGAAEAATTVLTAGAITNRNAQIWQSAGGDAYEIGTLLLENADPLTSSVWRKYESRMVLHDGAARRAFYNPDNGVTMNVAKSVSDSDNRGRLSTWFHEFGHHIDGLAAGKKWRWYSREAKLSDTVKAEVQEHVNAVHKTLKDNHKAAVKAVDSGDFESAISYIEENSSLRYLPDMYREALEHIGDAKWFENEGYPAWKMKTADEQIAFLKTDVREKLDNLKPNKQKAYEKVEREIRDMTDAEKHSLSDMFEGATSGKVQAGWGHGKSYWKKNRDYLSLESFAEFYSAECIYSETPQTLDTLRRYLPKSYERYREILKEVSEL